MYHHHSQPQGAPPNFPNRPGPSHHQQQQSHQQQGRSATDMLSPVLGFQYAPPTQLPDELESALAIRGSRDMDHRFMDQVMGGGGGRRDGPGMAKRSSEPESYSSGMVPLTFDNQSSHQQGVDWSSYQQPTKLFAGPPSGPSPQPHHHQGPPPQQQPQNSHRGAGVSGWNASVSDKLSPQRQGSHSGGSGGGVDLQGLYTPESAGSILASFGLSNEDLEVLSHYPDDQLTPDTLPFILRDIQINKSNIQNSTTSSSSYSENVSRGIHDMPPPPSCSSPLRPGRSRSPEVPSLLSVTQTAGKVIDYGHASRATDDSSTRETFKRERLSSKRTVKMYPSSSSSSSPAPKRKADMPPGRRQVRVEPMESERHGDMDYRRLGADAHKTKRSPGVEFPPSRPRADRDYRRDGHKPRPSSQTRHPPSSSSVSKPHGGTKRLPTPTMISDFSADPPKVYPHTCSLCHVLCDQAKDWTDHINTVNHTAACRDLRNKYPDWKPNLPRSESPVQDVRKQWRSRERSPSRSVSRSLSWSPSPSSPPSGAVRRGPHPFRHHPSRQHHQHHSGVSTGSSFHGGLKRSHGGFSKSPGKAGTKATKPASAKPVSKATKPASAKAVTSKERDVSVKPPPAKKKKKVVTPSSQSSPLASHLIYLTGIPTDASEQEVTDLVGAFGKINNVVLMPGSEAQGQQAEGQKASVCMVRAEDAQALAQSSSLFIREQQITASLAKKTVAEITAAVAKGKTGPSKNKSAAEDPGSEAEQKNCDERGVVLISGLPDSGWSESDIIKLAQPFGIPGDIIMAAEMGKVLVSMPDQETAQEMVKVHSFIPVKIQDSELKMCCIKQHVSLNTPVALYNLLNGPVDPSKSPVGWSSLLVISNVPDTPTAPLEVQRLVQRFGSIQNALVLNNSTIICEMETAAMALSVYKRFQKFPCIIQNNPLSFSRRADTKQSKVTTAYLEQNKASPASSKDNQTAAQPTDTAESAHKENGETATEGNDRESEGKNGEEGDEGTGDKEEGANKDGVAASNPSAAPQDHEPATKTKPATTPKQKPGDTKASSPTPAGEAKASSLAAEGEAKASSPAPAGEAKASSPAPAGEAKASSPAPEGEAKASSLAPAGEAKASSPAPAREAKASSLAPAGEAKASSLAPEGEAKASSLAPAGEAKASSLSPAGEAKASSLAPAEEAKASSPAPAGEAKASSLAPAGEAKASSLAPAGEAKASSLAPAGEAKASSLAPAGEAEASSLAPAGEAKASSLASAGEAKASNLAPAGEAKASSLAPAGEAKASSLAPTGEAKASSLAPAGKTKTPSSLNETKASTSNKLHAIQQPNVTNVLALLEECRSKASSRNTRAAPTPGGPQREKQPHTTGPVGEEKRGGKEVKKEVDTRNQEKEEKGRERKERDAKWQKEDTSRREREWKVRMRWEREREMKEEMRRKMKEAEKRDRRRGREGSSGSRSSGRSEGSRRSSRRDGQDMTTAASEAKKVEEDCFPFDLGDFVTVDEVGDVDDFPQTPPPHSPVAMDTAEEGTDAETTAPGSTPVSEATPPPGEEATPIPGQQAISTPGQEDTPTPDQEATFIPSQEVTPLPGQEATPTPGLEATPASKATPLQEATPTSVQDDTPVPAQEDMPKDTPTPFTMATAASETRLSPETCKAIGGSETGLSDPPDPQFTCSLGQTPPSDTAAGTAMPTPASDSTPDAESFPLPAPPTTLTPPVTALATTLTPPVTAPATTLTPPVTAPATTLTPPETATPTTLTPPETAPPTTLTAPETAPPTTITPPETASPTTLTPPESAPAVEAPAPPGGQEEGVAEHQSEVEAEEDELRVMLEKPEEEKREEEERRTARGTVKRQSLEGDRKEEEECVKKRQKTESVVPEDYRLPPFNPSSPVGMEFLVPKTGFFCKVCERFFNGSGEAERNHCRTLKHYQSLQKYLESRKTTNKTSG